MRFKLSFPDPKIVEDSTIVEWYRDAVKSGKIKTYPASPGRCKMELNVFEMAVALQDIGIIKVVSWTISQSEE